MWRIELVTAAGVEVLGWWPDPATARLIAGHYRRECGGAVRLRRCGAADPDAPEVG